MTNFSIKIISDTVCPFCYIGKKRLEKAIEVYKKATPEAANDTFTVTWYPFYLDPTLSTVSRPINEVMVRKFGSPERVAFINERMKATGQREGINFTLQGMVGNTRDSHRLIELAKTKGEQTQDGVVASLFRSYFEEGGDITSRDDLVAAGERGGLDAAEVRSWLEGDKGGREVDAEVESAYRRGVHGVPHFIINDDFEVGGAQEVDAFLAEFARAKRAAGGGAAPKGNTAADPSLTC